jgi:nitrosocyanin
MRKAMMGKFAMMRKITMLAAAGMIFCAASMARAQAAAPAAVPANLQEMVNGARHFTEVSVLIGTTKFWLPSTLVVNEGDKVEITLKNEVPGAANNQHGFEIPAYNIEKVVTAGTPEKVEFTADKPGVFVFGCQLHPAHVGGQLIVRPKG